jgi:uncharacterized protein YqjF (DUF2071 family)
MLKAVARNVDGNRPPRVARPALEQDWLELSFLHWSFPPQSVAALLPPGVCVDSFEGDAWVGLVLFRLRIFLRRGLTLPWLCSFPEINVRTYVVGPDGERGIWFFSLDCARLIAAWTGRMTYRLPFHHAAMRMDCGDGVRRYRSRRAPDAGTTAGGCSATVRVGEPVASSDVTALQTFLTQRWRLYTRAGGGVATAHVEHPPWRLHHAVATDVDAGLIAACGLPYPAGSPLVLAADGVRARLTGLRPCPGQRSNARRVRAPPGTAAPRRGV